MLRIQKAVLKAKDAQEHKTIRNAAQKSSPANSPLESLQYSKTKVVTPDPEDLENSRIVAGYTNNANSQTFRTLRTQVIQKMRENNWRSIGITSPSEGEGKSIIAANLAIAISMEVNQTVLLVDLNLKKPTLASLFGLVVDKGLFDYLKESAKIEDIMLNPGIDRLVLVPGHSTIYNSSEVVSGPKMVSFFNETKTRYKSRFVLYDMPPVLPSDDVLSSIGNVDCTLLVLEDGKNTEKDIAKTIQQIKQTPLLGTVVNKFQKGGWLF